MTLSGLFVPLITPFTARGDLATDALERLAHEAIDAGASGLVALGTTGEPATLTGDERRRVVEVCATVSRERQVPLVAGTGSNCTADSVRAFAALDGRVTAALVVVPYYTRPSEDGVVEHFRRLAAASPVPLLIYNIPYRTGRPLGVETLCRLADLPGVIGFKHAVGGIDAATVGFMSRCPVDVCVLGGDDLYAAPLLAMGASGAILASANVVPAAYAEMTAAWRHGPLERARHLGNLLASVSETLFAEPNPVVMKGVLAAQGRIPSPAVRLPLLPATDTAVDAALAALDRSYAAPI
ncbi:4-hydroxy-tetrahydrodipicolinate synthase [Nocardia mexicana]|uniref:4-hydroxy-tetrahydrodipicolinate synthase n=1 Tax=Nocardia mexicana TaxID=279262 RepID=A0A370H6G4_9NOCA|nr:4-hydroxy-tetrahydrodipicolinate synthase [Nocardia mexicana]RDI51997.1 4-hydroxy-tetrahydrodipicolinate synthase [Nocardia mexicana]